MATAFEAITTRKSWYGNATLAKYDAVQYDAAGKFVKADGTRPFAGIVEYGGAAGEIITVVEGAMPVIATEAVPAGSLVTIATGADAGKFKVAKTNGDVVYGVALTAAGAAGELFTLSMVPVPKTVTV